MKQRTSALTLSPQKRNAMMLVRASVCPHAFLDPAPSLSSVRVHEQCSRVTLRDFPADTDCLLPSF